MLLKSRTKIKQIFCSGTLISPLFFKHRLDLMYFFSNIRKTNFVFCRNLGSLYQGGEVLMLGRLSQMG